MSIFCQCVACTYILYHVSQPWEGNFCLGPSERDDFLHFGSLCAQHRLDSCEHLSVNIFRSSNNALVLC